MNKRTRQTQKYCKAVKWIACEDEPQEHDLEQISGYISVLLIADLFCVPSAIVARDVLSERRTK